MNEDTNEEAVRSGERTVHLELMPTGGCRFLTGAAGRMGRMPSGEYFQLVSVGLTTRTMNILPNP